jgi:hypothetical protein
MTNAYGNVKALSDRYGLACTPEGLSLAPTNGAGQPPGAAQAAGIGKPVRAGDQIVVVEKVEQWSSDSFFQPDAGNVYLTVFVAITPSTDSFINMLGTHVQATDGTSYDYKFVGAREPTLPTGTLVPKATVRGWMTFEVPRNLADHVTLLYAPSISDAPVSIALY